MALNCCPAYVAARRAGAAYCLGREGPRLGEVVVIRDSLSLGAMKVLPMPDRVLASAWPSILFRPHQEQTAAT